MLPSDQILEWNYDRAPKSKAHMAKRINVNDFSFQTHYASFYEHEAHKIKMASCSNVRLGEIISLEKKYIDLLRRQANLKRIPGTNPYYSFRQDQLFAKFHCFGFLAIITELRMPFFSLANKMSFFKKDTSTDFSCSVINDSKEEFEIVIEDKSLDLETFLDSEIKERIPIGVSAENISHFHSKFLSMIISNTSYEIGSEIYDSLLAFPTAQSHIKAKIISWPIGLEDINKKILRGEKISNLDEKKIIEFIDRNLTNSVLPEDLEHFKDVNADEVIYLAKKNMVDTEILSHFPSKATLITEIEENEEALEAYREINACIERRVYHSEFSMSTDEFIKNFEESEMVQVFEEDDLIFIIVNNFETSENKVFSIKRDKIIDNLMEENDWSLFVAVYHRAITSSSTHDAAFTIILKTSSILSCYVKMYSPEFIVAARTFVSTSLITENHAEIISSVRRIPDDVYFCESSPLNVFNGNHKMVSMLEAIWRVERNKKFSISSHKAIIVPTFRGPIQKFSLSKTENHENHYLDVTDKLYYDLVESPYSIYLKREASVNLCFYEFIAFYDRVDANKTVENTDVIRTSCGKVYRRNEERPCIFSKMNDDEIDSKYRQLLLFYPHQQDMSNFKDDEIESLFKNKRNRIEVEMKRLGKRVASLDKFEANVDLVQIRRYSQ